MTIDLSNVSEEYKHVAPIVYGVYTSQLQALGFSLRYSSYGRFIAESEQCNIHMGIYEERYKEEVYATVTIEPLTLEPLVKRRQYGLRVIVAILAGWDVAYDPNGPFRNNDPAKDLEGRIALAVKHCSGILRGDISDWLKVGIYSESLWHSSENHSSGWFRDQAKAAYACGDFPTTAAYYTVVRFFDEKLTLEEQEMYEEARKWHAVSADKS